MVKQMKENTRNNCQHLLNMGSAYHFKQCQEWSELCLSRCLAESDKDCPKKTHKRELSMRCWTIEKRNLEKYIRDFVKSRD
jgi:predicted kinase